MAQHKNTADAPGEHLVRTLKWVHGMLRRDLAALRELAAKIVDGASPEFVRSTVQSMSTKSPLWHLRVNCLQYCHFVHSHHGLEDVELFPALRRTDPELKPVIARLVADHLRISDLLDQVQALADLLGSDDSADTRQRLVVAIEELGPQLLTHLDVEEESISPALRRWRTWP